MSKKRYLSIFAFLFALLFAFALGFGLSACGKDKDEDDDGDKEPTTPTHTHSYVLDGDEWEWSDDFSTCWNTVTCKNEDGMCDKLKDTWYADVTSETTATCTEAGKTTYTATYGTDTVGTQEVDAPALGHTLQHTEAKSADCGTETDGNIEYWYCGVCEKYFSDAEAGTDSEIEKEDTVVAWAHTYTEESEGEDAWHWYVSADGTTYTATVGLKCSECKNTQTVNAEVTDNGDGTYTGTYAFSEDVVFTDTHTPTGDEEEIPEPEHTYSVRITTTAIEYTVGDTESFGAEVFCDNEEVKDATVAWTSSNVEVATIETSTGLFTAVAGGTAIITATYTYGEGKSDFVTATLEITIAGTQTQTMPTSISVDFSQEGTYSWIKTEDTTTADKTYQTVTDTSEDTYGVLSVVVFGTNSTRSITIGNASNAINFSNSTESDGGYIKIDLSDYVGVYSYVTLTVEMRTNSSSNETSLFIGTNPGATSATAEGVLAYATSLPKNESAGKSEAVKQKITFTYGITADNSVLYLTMGGNTNIYTIDMAFSDSVTSTGTVYSVGITSDINGTLTYGEENPATATLTADVVMSSGDSDYGNGQPWTDGGYTWTVETTEEADVITLSESTSSTVGITAVGVGTATVTVRLWLDPSKTATYSIEVTGAEKNSYQIVFTGNVVITEGGSTTITASLVDDGNNPVTDVAGTFTWTTDQGSISLSADTGESVTVTGIEATGNNSAKITVTFVGDDGSTGEGDVYIVVNANTGRDGDPYGVYVDFAAIGDELSGKFGTEEAIVLDEEGVVTYRDGDGISKVESGALTTDSTGTGKGYTNFTGTINEDASAGDANAILGDDSNYTNYIYIDFSEYEGYSFEIDITFTAGGTDATVAVMQALAENLGGTAQGSTIFGTNAPNISSEVGATTSAGSAATFWYAGSIYTTSNGELLNGGLYIVWDATVKISEITVDLWCGERPVDLTGDWSGFEIDFADPSEEFKSAFAWTGDEGREIVAELGRGVLTIVDREGDMSWSSDSGVLAATKATHSATNSGDDEYDYTNYMKVNLNGLQGQSVVITVTFKAASGSANMAIVSALSDLSNGGTISNLIVEGGTKYAVTTMTKLSVVITIPQESDGVMYIVYDAAINIQSIKISIGSEPDTSAVYTVEIDASSASTTLDIGGTENGIIAKITVDGIGTEISEIDGASLEWKSSNTDVAVVDSSTGAITAVSAGYTYITVTLTTPEGEILVSGGIGIIVNVGEAPEGTSRYNFTSSDLGWDTTLAVTAGTISLDEAGLLSYVTSTYNQGWQADDVGVHGLKTGLEKDYGATYGGSGNYSNYFVVDVGVAQKMTISVMFSAVSVSEKTSEESSYVDHATGYVALLPTLPTSFSLGEGANESTTSRREKLTGTSFSQTVSALIDDTAIKDTAGVGYANAVTFTWTGDISDYDKIYIFLGASMYIYNIDISLEYHEHEYDYDQAVWAWGGNDEQGYTSATVTLTCNGGNCDHTEGETLTAQATITDVNTQTSCEEAGTWTFTATACINGTELTDTKEIQLAAGQHTYGEPVYLTESEDGVEADGWYFVCTKGDSTIAIETGTDYTFTVKTEAELGAALSLAGATVVLGTDITVTSTIEVSAAATLNLGTYTISGGISEALISVIEDGKLEINGSGTISNENGIALSVSGGKLTIVEGAVTGNTALTVSAGEVTIEGGTITGSETAISITQSGATVAITDAGVTVNGALSATDGGFDISAGTFSDDPSGFLTSDYVASQQTDGKYVVEENGSLFYIDFSDPSTYAWLESSIGSTTSGVTSGIVTYVAAGSSKASLDAADGRLTMGAVANTYANYSYFKIDLSGLEQGTQVKFTIKYGSTSGSSTSVILAGEVTSSTSISGHVHAVDSTSDTTHTAELKVTVDSTAAVYKTTTLYLEFNAAAYIYSINIEVV